MRNENGFSNNAGFAKDLAIPKPTPAEPAKPVYTRTEEPFRNEKGSISIEHLAGEPKIHDDFREDPYMSGIQARALGLYSAKAWAHAAVHGVRE